MTEQPFRPERQNYSVHAGAIETAAILPEWWGALDSDTESRSLRFPGDEGVWLSEDELPEALQSAGCRLSEIVAANDHHGLEHPALVVGMRVLLRPEPDNAQAHGAIAVWVGDGSQQVGYLPQDVAAHTMAEAQRLGTGFGGFVASEVRDTSSHERRAITVFLGPGAVWAKESD